MRAQVGPEVRVSDPGDRPKTGAAQDGAALARDGRFARAARGAASPGASSFTTFVGPATAVARVAPSTAAEVAVVARAFLQVADQRAAGRAVVEVRA